jgi:8-oxo-dGTP diphosphatase
VSKKLVYNGNGEIRAAGGVVFAEIDGKTCVALVHRPRYGDWSLPKGKVRAGESDADAAQREVAEETGLECELLGEIGTLHYFDRKRRAKAVRFWAMSPASGTFVPNEEVDRVEWLDLRDAAAKATRSGERDFLTRLDEQRSATGATSRAGDGDELHVFEP